MPAAKVCYDMHAYIILDRHAMDETKEPRFYRRKDAYARENVQWNPPATRAQQVYHHHVKCAFCSREFDVESLMPISPTYCLESDPEGCFKQRRAAYRREQRAKQKGDTQEE